MLAFIDIDIVNDFFAGGALAVPGADGIRRNLGMLTSKALVSHTPILAFNDAHPNNAPEFDTFPPHCIAGTEGAEKIRETNPMNHGDYVVRTVRNQSIAERLADFNANMIVFQKNTYDAFDPEHGNPNIEPLLKDANVTDAVVYGVVTEICVDAAVRGLIARGIQVHVVTDAIMHLDEQKMEACFEAWYQAGVYFTTTDIVVL